MEYKYKGLFLLSTIEWAFVKIQIFSNFIRVQKLFCLDIVQIVSKDEGKLLKIQIFKNAYARHYTTNENKQVVKRSGKQPSSNHRSVIARPESLATCSLSLMVQRN